MWETALNSYFKGGVSGLISLWFVFNHQMFWLVRVLTFFNFILKVFLYGEKVSLRYTYANIFLSIISPKKIMPAFYNQYPLVSLLDTDIFASFISTNKNNSQGDNIYVLWSILQNLLSLRWITLKGTSAYCGQGFQAKSMISVCLTKPCKPNIYLSRHLSNVDKNVYPRCGHVGQILLSVDFEKQMVLRVPKVHDSYSHKMVKHQNSIHLHLSCGGRRLPSPWQRNKPGM